MQILAIGNSFSQDATKYLHDIAKCDGEKLTVVNLYIGGCPLSRHYRNMLSKEKAYSLEFNGASTGFFVNLDEALLSRDWDYITVQQASKSSIDYDTYQPYLEDLTSYIRMCCPKAKLIMHETWAYEEGCKALSDNGFSTGKEMYDALHSAYGTAAYSMDAYMTIPSGTLFQSLAEKGLNIHRDTQHASFGIGRYALALLWYTCLTGADCTKNTFNEFDEEISTEDIETIKNCISSLTKN
ncbi:MAG: DUF4886 domain-containing protein [Oscillospiraceae bacterium]|nr:DUF4886 domain-containing protein [Oscillospiraceae bacterium]MBQ9984934.1 DUF4886 domain-containing protein [Oscillospiraceae bacterium]